MLLDDKLFSFIKQIMSGLSLDRTVSYVSMVDCKTDEDKTKRLESKLYKASFIYFQSHTTPEFSGTKITGTDGHKGFEIFINHDREHSDMGIAFDKICHLSSIASVDYVGEILQVSSDTTYTLVNDIVYDFDLPEFVEGLFVKSVKITSLFGDHDPIISSVSKRMKEFDTAVLKLGDGYKKTITKEYVVVEGIYDSAKFRAISTNSGVLDIA